MNGNKNVGQVNTENPYDLLKASQRDILTIKSIIKDDDVRLEDNVETICRSAAESSEKMLKAYILQYDNTIRVYGNHDLEKLNKIASSINNKFTEIEDQINFLNNYTTELRYNSKFIIQPHEVKQCLNCLKNIYDFSLINELRNNINKDKKFNILPDNIGELFGKYY